MAQTAGVAAARNHLIELLPPRDRQRLLDTCEPVRWSPSETLFDIGDTARHVHFPVEGFASLMTRVDQHPGLEVGMVGREGLLGMQLSLGVATMPWRALVQGPGLALRLSASAFGSQLADSGALQHMVQRYLYVRMAQMASGAACLRFHRISQRLARWLLMTQDRAQADQFHATHEFLALMLGVRRVGITGAAGALQRLGLVQYHRGEVRVLDRGGLEGAACSCYANERQIYAQWLT